MRALTADEKAVSEAARKRVNKIFAFRRTEIGQQLRKMPNTATRRREELHHQFAAIRDIKGLPAMLRFGGAEIMLNYELYRRMIRTLKGRQWRQEIWGNKLVIIHGESRNGGTIELHELPQYQRDLLTDLPTIILD